MISCDFVRPTHQAATEGILHVCHCRRQALQLLARFLAAAQSFLVRNQ